MAEAGDDLTPIRLKQWSDDDPALGVLWIGLPVTLPPPADGPDELTPAEEKPEPPSRPVIHAPPRPESKPKYEFTPKTCPEAFMHHAGRTCAKCGAHKA